MQLHPQCTVYWLAWLLFKDDLVFGREDDLGRRKSLRARRVGLLVKMLCKNRKVDFLQIQTKIHNCGLFIALMVISCYKLFSLNAYCHALPCSQGPLFLPRGQTLGTRSLDVSGSFG